MTTNDNETVISLLLDCLRNSPFDLLQTFEFSLQILAWAKLSKEEKIPIELRLDEKSLYLDARETLSRFTRLNSLYVLGENASAFESIFTKWIDNADTTLLVAMKVAIDIAQTKLLKNFQIPEKSLSALGRDTGYLQIPREVVELMTNLAGDLSEKQVYCPYDTFCLFAQSADKKNAEVFVESPIFTTIPWLTNILSETSIHAEIGNPILQPSFIENGNLRCFDISVAFPPMGLKYDADAIRHYWHHRFFAKTNSGNVLCIQHLIAQTKDRVIVAVPNSLLFSRGAEYALREYLLNNRMIEAVIGMPPALLSLVSIPFSILILDIQGKPDHVRFVDGSDEKFFEKDARNRSRLIHWKSLLETFNEGYDEAIVRNIPIENILQNDCQLEVSRYLLPPEQKRVIRFLNTSETAHLKDLVDFVRPSTKLIKDGDLDAFEVSLSDFPEFGYLKTPERTILVSQAGVASKESKSFLSPGDIVIAIKGSVGKVAIVPDDVPSAKEGGWVVNQSCLILRSFGKIDPKILFMYLRSDVGQTLLKGIVSGATIPLIQLGRLQDLQIIIPPQDEAQELRENFDEQVKFQNLIEALQEKQRQLDKLHWAF